LETCGEMVLAVGDVVVYASHGVGLVAARREHSVVVEFATSGLSVVLPLERAFACIRPLSTEAQIVGIGHTLGGADSDVYSNWQHRLKATKAKVTRGEAVELAEVIRDAARREERASVRNEPRNLSLTERQLYVKARQLLADEISASRGVDQARADEWIDEQLVANAQHERSPARQERSPRTHSPTSSGSALAAVGPSGNRARRRRL
jgi:CarD family transcriptional regulator, regulator of rRNA transcription